MTTHEITRGGAIVPRREAWQAFHTKLLIGQQEQVIHSSSAYPCTVWVSKETNRGKISQRVSVADNTDGINWLRGPVRNIFDSKGV
jgi:hypothetical protein